VLIVLRLKSVAAAGFVRLYPMNARPAQIKTRRFVLRSA
jgi:hypothetical protein